MGSAIDLFVTYRFLKLLTTPFNRTDAYKLGIIDKNGHRVLKPKSTKPQVELATTQQKNAYTILHKLVFNIKKLFAKVPGLKTKVGTYAAALFLLKDTFKEHVEDPRVFETEFIKFLRENNIEFDNEISEEVIGFGEVLPKGNYVLVNDILNKDDEEVSARKGDLVMTFEDQAPVDTVLGIDIFPVRFASLSENSLLISSIFKTLLVLHLTKFANFVLTSCMNLDFDPLLIVSMSLPKSKLLIASTLCSVITSAETTVALVIAIPTLALEEIPVSAKFLSPLVWSNLFTGSTISSKVLGLWIVYDKFWW